MSNKIKEKSKSTVIVDPKSAIKPEFENELEKGLITKLPRKSNKKTVYVNAKGQRVNENGELLTKRGQIDKRALNKAVGEVSKKRWQEVAEKNKNPNVKVVATVDSDSDSEPEFEIETIQPPAPVPPVPVSPPEPSRTELFIKQEEEKRKKFDEEIFKLKEENSKLKSGLHFNDHLNRISHMARQTKIRF